MRTTLECDGIVLTKIGAPSNDGVKEKTDVSNKEVNELGISAKANLSLLLLPVNSRGANNNKELTYSDYIAAIKEREKEFVDRITDIFREEGTDLSKSD